MRVFGKVDVPVFVVGILGLMPLCVAGSAASEIQVTGVTATQAILRYEAPPDQVCSIRVSDDPNLETVVNDVNPQLFPGSELDSRSGTVRNGDGTERVVVIGKRVAEAATNLKLYSRALQAYTTHYVQIDCGSDSMSTTFTTMNIPLGSTYSDPLPADRNRPGEYAWPTLDSRFRRELSGFVSKETVIDPGTGILIRRVTLPNDLPNNATPTWHYAAGAPMCSQDVVADQAGNMGYYCMIPLSDGAPGLYWINPANGDARFLHSLWLPAQGGTDGWPVGWCSTPHASFEGGNPRVFYCSQNGALVRVEYNGTNQPRAGSEDVTTAMRPCSTSAPPCFRMTNITPRSRKGDVGSQVAQFDSRFEPSKFNCNIVGVQNTHAIYNCMRSSQDSVSWIVVLDVSKATPVCTESNNCIVAATPGYSEGTRRWCGTHAVGEKTGGTGALVVGTSLAQGNTGAGDGPFASSIVSGPVAAAATACPPNPYGATNCLTLTVDGEPRDLTPSQGETGAAGELMAAQIGDYFRIATVRGVPWFAERLRLLQKDGNRWTLQRAIGFTQAQDFNDPAPMLFTFCSNFRLQEDASMMYVWNYEADPHGLNENGQTVQIDSVSYVHGSEGPNAIVGEGYGSDCKGLRAGCLVMRYGPTTWDATAPANARVELLVSFAGRKPDPIYNEPYVTWTQINAPEAEQLWVTDIRAFLQFFDQKPVEPVSGTLYKISAPPLDRKRLPTESFSSTRPLVDISGPGSQISDGPEDNYKYCVALNAGECQPDSKAGDYYGNVPQLTLRNCTGGHLFFAAPQRDLCVSNHSFSINELTQYGFRPGQDTGIGEARVLSRLLNSYRAGWFSARHLADGSWTMWNAGTPDGKTNVLIAKLPPYPEPDGVNRMTFIPVPIEIPALEGAASAVVEFGYTEEGSAEDFYCTSRREACVATTASVNEADPFRFRSESSYVPTPCAKGCSIAVPAIPQRVVYFRVLYLDENREVIGLGPKGVAAEQATALFLE